MATHRPLVLAGGAIQQLPAGDGLKGELVAAQFVIDGAGAVITTGFKGHLHFPFACTIEEWTLLADQSGGLVIDLWKKAYSSYPPADADSITASLPPTLSAQAKNRSTSFTGWTLAIAADDVLGVNVDSASTITRATLALKLRRT